MDVPKSALQALHTPVIYVQGGPTDIAYANGHGRLRADRSRARGDDRPAGGATAALTSSPMAARRREIVVDWLEWQLRGDAEAAKSFLGEDCGLCGDPEVAIETRNLP